MFTDDTKEYDDVFRELPHVYKLDWKDVKLLLTKTFTSNKKQAPSLAAMAF